MKDLSREIADELNLKAELPFDKEAALTGDPLVVAINAYLDEHPYEHLDEHEYNSSSEIEHMASFESKLDPDPVFTTLTATMIDIEKQAGEVVFPDHIKRFVFNAEEAGASVEEIEEVLEKQGGILTGIGRTLKAPFNKMLRARTARKTMDTAIDAMVDTVRAEPIADQAVARAVRAAGADIKLAPSFMDRIVEVVNPGHVKTKRLLAEGKLKGAVDDIVTANEDYLADPKRMQDLIREMTGSNPQNIALKEFLKAKPVLSSKLDLTNATGAEALGAGMGQKWDIFKKKKYFKPLAGGGAGAGLAYLIGNHNSGGGGHRSGPVIIT